MIKEIRKKGFSIGVFIFCLIGVISCEKDFKDVSSSVISNSKFDTKDTVLEVVVTNKPITSVRADGLEIGGSLGQYLLGVYNNPNYEKIEASFVSPVIVPIDLKLVGRDYASDTTVVSTIDSVFLKLPYQATLKTDSQNEFTLDSIIGDPTVPFTVNIFQSGTYLNNLNPNDPSKTNSFQSDAVYQKVGSALNATPNYQFIPKATDTILYINRKLSDGSFYKKDSLILTKNNPFARIPLDKAKIKQLLLDKYGSSDFESQTAFNQYFKGLYVEATGNSGSLIGFDFNSTTQDLKPAIEIYYTNTVLKGGTTVIDTIARHNTFFLSSFTNSIYKMADKTYPVNNDVVLQGTAGSMANIQLFDAADANNNNISDQIEQIRSKHWLINDASLTFYVDQNIVQSDTIATPYKLFLFKDGATSGSQLKDLFSEGPTVFGGNLEIDNKKPNKYTFRITDYVSDLLNAKSDYNPLLGLKVINSATDFPTSATDTIVKTYNWNPKTVTLLNHNSTNGTRRAQLKISYSIKK